MSTILTHDRIKTTSGVLAKDGLLFGGHALQSVTIARNTPRNPVQAVGKLGIVDYTSGVILSDISVDTIIVEGGIEADVSSAKANSIYRYAARQLTAGIESYCLTGATVNFSSNAAATMNLQYLTSGLASYLDAQAQPQPGIGEENAYCVVMGDDGSGVEILVDWYNATTAATDYIAIIDSNGNLRRDVLSDNGLPGGAQSISVNCSVQRDQILDLRSTTPVQFVTTYPLNLRADMELHVLPVAVGNARPGEAGYDPTSFKHLVDNLKTVTVRAAGLNKHVTGGAANAGTTHKNYLQISGLRKLTENEAVSVGRYLSYTFSFDVADVVLPLDYPS